MANKEIVREWVNRLRSGKYIQGPGRLAAQHGAGPDAPIQHCCLGVLSEIAAEQNVVTKEEYTDSFGDKGYDFSGGTALPPFSVGEWAEVEAWFVDVPYGKFADVDEEFGLRVEGETARVPLTALNDTYGASFEQIADLLEAHYLS